MLNILTTQAQPLQIINKYQHITLYSISIDSYHVLFEHMLKLDDSTGGQRQEDQGFKARLNYIASLKRAWATMRL